MKILFIILFLTTVLVSSKELEKVSLQLHWKYQFEFAGFIAAKEKGFYEEVGLDVELKEFNYGLDIENEVLEGKSNYGIYSSSILLSYLQNKPIKLLASFFKRSAMVLVTKPEIKSPKDLIGKKIMTDTKKDFDLRFKYMFDSQKVDTNDLILVKHTYNVNAFAKGEIDAIASFISDEPYKLDALGVKYNIINPSDYGMYNLLLELFTSETEAKEHSHRTEAFRKASIKGWQYALKNKKEIINIIHQKYAKKSSIKVLENEANKIEKLILPYAYEIGSIDKNFLNKQLEIFKKEYNITSDNSLDDFIFNNSSNTNLNEKETKYLKALKNIKICINPDWTPIEFLEDNEAKGISIDTLKIIQEKLNIQFEFITTSSWVESQEFLKKRYCDILPSAIKTKERLKYANFTKPYLNYSLAIITTQDKPLVSDIASLSDKTMSRKQGSGLISKFKKKYPNMKIKETKNYIKSFENILNKKAYFTITTIPILSYYKKIYKFKNLQIAGFLDQKYLLSIAVRNDDKVLLNILNKKLSEISNKTHNIIYDKWANQQIKKEFDYALFGKILIFIFIFILFLLILQIRLKRHNFELENRVKERTKELENKNKILIKEIKKRKEIQNNLIKAKDIAEESARAKTNFLASISHELRTPMNSILGYSSMGAKKIDTADKTKLLKFFNNINTSGSRLLNLLEDLINIAKLESGKNNYFFKNDSLSQAIKESIQDLTIFAEEKQIKINFKTENDIHLMFDYKRLIQVLSNIISNAIKFSPNNSDIDIQLKKDKDSITISIKDEGIGIDKEDLRNIFNSFVQGKRSQECAIKGSGLGLAISKKIIDNHDGKIWAINNKNGIGSIFIIQLPINKS